MFSSSSPLSLPLNLLPKDILVIFALEAEAGASFSDLAPFFSGVGKINAAYRLACALHQWRDEKGSHPKLVLNLGSAGSQFFDFGQIVNCVHFIQRDFDTTAVGEALYETPHEKGSACLKNGISFDDFPQGVCGTGDNFETNLDQKPWNVVDMEAYAFAKICCLEKVPFACLKYITDGADDAAPSSWQETVVSAAKELRKATEKIVGF